MYIYISKLVRNIGNSNLIYIFIYIYIYLYKQTYELLISFVAFSYIAIPNYRNNFV